MPAQRQRSRSLILLAGLVLAAASVPAVPDSLAGSYRGDYKGNAASGTFRLSLETGAGGAWKCAVSFTLNGEDVKTTMRECRVDQSKIEAAYDFDALGLALRSHITGEWKSSGFEGSYRTTTTDGTVEVDQGAWSAARE